MANMVELRDVSKTFGNFTALRNVSFEIKEGEFMTFLGPSGCGKTTCLRLISGFDTPSTGRVLIAGDDVTFDPPYRRDVNQVFQSYALFPHLTIFENIAFGLRMKKVPAAEIKLRVDRVVEMTALGQFVERKPAQMSGGQRQRVALARALVIRPRCLLLDEPLSNLDAKLRLEMRTEIRRVCKEFGLTAIYVTHDQKEALSISDRMAILEGGRIAQIGTPEEVYRKPRTKIVADFIGETNFLPGKIHSTTSDRAVVETAGSGLFEGIVGDPNWQPEAGEDVTVSIRPECWSLSDQAEMLNCLRGRIGESIYLGEVAQYQFFTGGTKLKIFELNPRLSARTSDRDLFAVAKTDDVVVLRK